MLIHVLFWVKETCMVIGSIHITILASCWIENQLTEEVYASSIGTIGLVLYTVKVYKASRVCESF